MSTWEDVGRIAADLPGTVASQAHEGSPAYDVARKQFARLRWDDTGRAPEVLLGTKRDGSLTRPHCAWPNVARYRGSGDANDPANWQCVARAS